MTKKSAASAKIKAVRPPEPTLEEKQEKLQKLFDENKWAFEETVKTQIVLARRFDNFANIRDLVERILGKDNYTYELLHDLVDESEKCYKEVLKQVEKFELAGFTGEEPTDYFKDIMPDEKAVNDDLEFIYGILKYMSVRPYGDKMLQLYQTIQNAKRELGL